jgi:hypothetical protein
MFKYSNKFETSSEWRGINNHRNMVINDHGIMVTTMVVCGLGNYSRQALSVKTTFILETGRR